MLELAPLDREQYPNRPAAIQKQIAAIDLDFLAEPFFIAKPVGQGTGLGLAIACAIVKKHGGKIEVNSQIGQGAKLAIILPLKRDNRSTGATL